MPVSTRIRIPDNAPIFTLVFPSTAVLPLTVAMVPIMAAAALNKNSSSIRNSSSGNSFFSSILPAGMMTSTIAARLHAISGNDLPH